ncbi:MAG: 1-acyl-sn-glycerol-3-phosphate acyltransferase [Sulfurovaceae bacterium]|nr:1-acyl-sn-glycerol-3-phosphate acyltransferase [Sulfurovaceae bacterium]
MKMFATIRFYYGSFIISFIAAGIMVPLMMIFKNQRNYILHKWNRIIMILIGGKIKITGSRDNTANMFVVNHQGIIDIISMEAAENSNLRWVAKKQLFDAPWFGYVLKLPEMICIDRDSKSGLIKLLRDVKETTTSNIQRTVTIFPEGTRTNKQKLIPFKDGTKIIAEKLQLSIQPIVITNSKLLLNEHNKTAHSATVHITYLDTLSVDKSNKNWYKELQLSMQNIIDEEKKNHKRER